MILEVVPDLPNKRRNGHHAVNRTSRHYAATLRAIPTVGKQAGSKTVCSCIASGAPASATRFSRRGGVGHRRH